MDIQIPVSTFVDEQGVILEEGPAYNAKLVDFGEAPDSYNPGEMRLVWRFHVEDPDSGENEVEAAAFTSQKVSDGKYQSNLVKYAKLLNDGELPTKGGNVDLEALLNKSCRVTIKPYTKASGITKNRVAQVLAPKGASTSV